MKEWPAFQFIWLFWCVCICWSCAWPSTPHHARHWGVIRCQLKCACLEAGLSLGTFSPAEFIFLISFLAACVIILLCADLTGLVATTSGHRRHCRLLLHHQINLFEKFFFFLEVYYTAWALHYCKNNYGYFGHTKALAEWSNVAWNKMLNCQSSSICGLFYLRAQISLLSYFHLHHFACPIELDWLHLQEGDGHHKKAADGWSEIKCKQRMCTNPPIRPPLSAFVEESGIITLGRRPVAMWSH